MARSPATCGCRATARRSATGRRPWRCTCCAGSYAARRPLPDDAAEHARLFVALDLPPRARERLVEWRSRAVGGRGDLRLVGERSLHVTLAFIGRRPIADVDPIATALTGALAGARAARLAATAPVGVPRRRPRLFALDLEDRDGRAALAQNAIARALSDGGWYEPEKRAFWPHITFARVVRGARDVTPVDSPPPPPQPFSASLVTLYRSHLSPRGSRYEALAQVRLGR